MSFGSSLNRETHRQGGVLSRCEDNTRPKRKGTKDFMAVLHRLVGRCIRASAKGRRAPVREAFELLFELLRRIDEAPDDVIFFADEAGSWQLGVDWRAALPAYFRCVADTASPEEFASAVDRTIANFADYERPRLLRLRPAAARGPGPLHRLEAPGGAAQGRSGGGRALAAGGGAALAGQPE